MPSRLSALVIACLLASSLVHAAAPSLSRLTALPVPPPATAGLEPSLAPSPPLDVLMAPQPVRRLPAIAQVAMRDGQCVKYPVTAVTATAIVKIATRQVSSGRHRCAATMREALGWGLGDAHQWLSLTDCGFTRRPAGEPAQPGDIVVWPFTFGSRRSQHIGIAVGTDAGTRLLSNLTGSICVSALADGYCAFYKPSPPCQVSLPSALPSPQLRAEIVTAPTAVP